ncbi:MAG: hypothetical protein ABIZ72_03880 [Candidatus Limnocylindrales bacterium]
MMTGPDESADDVCRIPAAVGYTGLLSTFLAAGSEVVHEIDSAQVTVRRVIVRRHA